MRFALPTAGGSTVQKYEKFGRWQRKVRKNLHGKGKMLIFAASNIRFGYPGDIPAWGKPTPTLPNLKELPNVAALLLFCVFLQEDIYRFILRARELGL